MRVLILLLALALAACQTLPYQRDDDLPTVVALQDGSPERAAMNARVYDAAVRTVSRRFYDRTFNGVDFAAEAAAARDAAIAQPTEAAFYAALNTVLTRLDDTHTRATAPRLNLARYQRDRSELAVLGVTLTRVTERDSEEPMDLVLDLDPDGPMARAGVRRGWRLMTIAGRPARDVLRQGDVSLDRPQPFGFLDERGDARDLTIQAEVLPRRLGTYERRADGVAVIWLSVFDEASVDWFLARMDAVRADPPAGLIIDVRGNPGGISTEIARVLGTVLPPRTRFAHWRVGILPRRALATPRTGTPYAGPLVVLQSTNSASASEIFAAAIQEARRGLVVGQTSSGSVVGSQHYRLPDAGMVSIGVSALETAQGKVLEKVGVVPDIRSDPTAADLRAGRDTILERGAQAVLTGS